MDSRSGDSSIVGIWGGGVDDFFLGVGVMSGELSISLREADGVFENVLL